AAAAMLFQKALSGPHPADPFTLPDQPLTAEAGSLKGMRIAWSMDLGFFEVDPEVRAATAGAIQTLKDLGAQTEEIRLPWDWDVIQAALTHLRALFGTSIAPDSNAGWFRMTPYAREFARAGLDVSSSAHLEAVNVAGRMGQEFGALMENFDLLVCPTTAIPAVRADFDHSQEPLEINGQQVEPMLGWVMTAPFNMLSSCPVLSLPAGRAASGVPIGVQFAGQPYDENAVFRAGLSYEAARGAWFRSDTLRPACSAAETRLSA
ncbi:MAG: amidase family protein, partial [Leisingera sp.]